jgi:RecB family exonuclease
MRFHRMVQQYHLGIPEEKISRWLEDADLKTWWDAFLAHPPANLPSNRQAEVYLSMPFDSFRLAAKIDLLAMGDDSRVVILDWKTTHKPPRAAFIQKRVQSLVYPYLLMHTGCALNGFKPVEPSRLTMIYWFPAFPEKSVTLTFDQTWLETTHANLTRLVQEISRMKSDVFPLTSDMEKCKFCRFRSLCERGITAGNLENEDEYPEDQETLLDFNFDEIQGIAF